mmetsp:Transcript_2580/g.3501  ORF Transcript_2580/g.3501 Transcript_2580/m.3501 type:complete len:180 (+) Transcript_2580:75-614(+)
MAEITQKVNSGASTVDLPNDGSPSNAFRRMFWKIAVDSKFDFFILLSIAINCFFMAIEDPVRAGDDDTAGIMYFNIHSDTAVWVGRILLWIFTVEALIKVIAFTPWGYFYGPDRNWNRLDYTIVLVGWLDDYPALIGAIPFKLSFFKNFPCLSSSSISWQSCRNERTCEYNLFMCGSLS